MNSSNNVARLLAGFLPTSMLVRLIEGNEDVTHRHLQQLFHKGLINRFTFPRTGGSNECNYYLDNLKSLALLVERGLAEKADLDFEVVRRNKETAYHKISDAPEDLPGRMLFLHHELMISRFHFMLELGCKKSAGKIELGGWKQGPELHGKDWFSLFRIAPFTRSRRVGRLPSPAR